MRSLLTHALLLALLAAVAVGALALVGPAPGRDTALEGVREARPLPVETVAVERVVGLRLPHAFTGELRARRTVDVAFEVGGEVLAVEVVAGEAVTAGQALARVDTRRLEAERARLAARRAQLAATLDELEAGPRAETIDAARARVAAAAAEVALVDGRLDRRRGLAAGTVSEEQVRDLEAQRAAAEASRAAAAAWLAELERGTRAEQVAAQRAAVDEVDATLAALGVDLADAELVAPFDGVVERRHVDEGALVAPGAPAVRVVEAGRLEAWLGLTPEAATAFVAGAPARLTLRGESLEYAAVRVLPELDRATRTRTVVLELPPGATDGAPGELARLEVDLPVEGEGSWLPVEALTEGARGLWSVFVARTEGAGEPRAERAAVEVLHTLGDRVFVRGTLAPGDRVIVGGTHALAPGQRVALTGDGVAVVD